MQGKLIQAKKGCQWSKEESIINEHNENILNLVELVSLSRFFVAFLLKRSYHETQYYTKLIVGNIHKIAL